jgi:plasmid maintenance system antidote protein VapI
MTMKPRHPIHSGEMLLDEFLRPAGVNRRQFARQLGWTTAKLNELMAGADIARPADDV